MGPSKGGVEKSLDGMSGLGITSLNTARGPIVKGNEVPGLSDMSLFGPKMATPAGRGVTELDYNKILTQFYERHNPAKIGSVAATLKKYKGREPEMFEKIAQNYGVESPLENLAPDTDQAASSTAIQQVAKKDPGAPWSKPPLAPSPFASPQASQSVGPSFASPSPFSSSSSQNQQASPFSFGSSTSNSPSQFNASLLHQQSPGTASFSGKSARDTLYAFYQQRNPSKLGEVDKLLAKYQRNEEQMFRNLAKKYNLDPSVFGLQPDSTTSPRFAAPSPTGGFDQP